MKPPDSTLRSGPAGLLFGAAWLLIAGCLNQTAGTAPPAGGTVGYGAPADSAFAAGLWRALAGDVLVGPDALQARPYAGRPPHGPWLQVFDGLLRVGRRIDPVVVLRSYRDGGAGAVGALTSVDVIYRRPGYAPAAGDWFWVSYRPDGQPRTDAAGRPLAGRIGSAATGAGTDAGPAITCIGCHRVAPGGDFVFGHDRYRQ